MKELIRKLVEAFGPSGTEDAVRELIAAEIKPHVDELRTDALGNLIALKKGNGKGRKIMLAGHMDELGLMVTHIDDKGFLRFSTIGGIQPHVLASARVVFADGVMGVVGSERLEELKDLKHEKLFIDIGAKDKAAAEAKVSIGDVCGYWRKLDDLGDRLVAKAMDDRIGCAVMIEAAKRLKHGPNDVYFVFTVQEEVGLRGARTAAYAVDPDFGLAFDVTRTGDTPKTITMDVAVGKGAAIKVKDSSMVTHPMVKNHLVATAEKHKIPYQLEVLEAGGTDAGAIHLTKAGVPSGTISIPCRYIHTPNEMVDIGDVEACVQLCVAVCGSQLPV
ncbi:MAG: M42 family metallopeptidase [Bacillota bacterium]